MNLVPPSELRTAWNNTLVTHASGANLDALATQYGITRPSFITRTAWRRALEACALAYRGCPNPTQFFLEGALSDFAVVLTVTLDPSRPTQLYSAGAEFYQALVGRLVRIPDYGLFRVGGPQTVTGETLDLVTVATSYWQVPDWTVLPSPVNVEVEFLAFFTKEDQNGPPSQTLGDNSGTLTVCLFPDVIEGVPPTFIQSGVEYLVASVNAGADTITTTDPHGLSTDDPVNVYPLTGVSVTHVEGFLANTLTLAMPGIFDPDELVHIYPGAGGVVPSGTSAATDYYAQWANDDGSLIGLSLTAGGSFVAFADEGTLPLYVAPAGAGNPAGVEPGGLNEFLVYYAIVVSPTVLSVALTPGGGPVNISSAGTAPLYVGLARPEGEAAGGILMPNASDGGNPSTPLTGPYPLFLATDTTLPELAEAMLNVLPAPIKARFVRLPTVP